MDDKEKEKRLEKQLNWIEKHFGDSYDKEKNPKNDSKKDIRENEKKDYDER